MACALEVDKEIDHCIICNSREPQHLLTLSTRLDSRLRYVTGVLPDLDNLGSMLDTLKFSSGTLNEDGTFGTSVDEDNASRTSADEDNDSNTSLDEDNDSGTSADEDNASGASVDEDRNSGMSNDEDRNVGIASDECFTPEVAKSPSLSDALSELNMSEASATSNDLYESEGTISAVASPNRAENEMPLGVTLSLENFYVLKLVFQHPLDHLTTEVMMLLVQSPADWFVICPSCRILVSEGIELINALKQDRNKEKAQQDLLTEKLETNLYHLRSKFLTTMFQRTSLVAWEFHDLADYADITTVNFLQTEEEAVLSFRQMLLTTALQRVVNLVDTSKLPLPVEDSMMDFTYSPAYSPEVLIDSDSPGECQSDQPEEVEDEIGQPDWVTDEGLDDELFCGCLE